MTTTDRGRHFPMHHDPYARRALSHSPTATNCDRPGASDPLQSVGRFERYNGGVVTKSTGRIFIVLDESTCTQGIRWTSLMAEDEFLSKVYSRGACTVTVDGDKQVPTED